MEYDSTLKRNEILIHVTTQMSVENIMQSKISQTQKDKYCLTPLTWGTQNRQIHRAKK